MRTLIVWNDPSLSADHQNADSESGVLEAVAAATRSLQRRGHEVVGWGIDELPDDLCRQLRQRDPDVIVNLFEGFAETPDTEALAAAAMESSGIPFTGSESAALERARRKDLAKTHFISNSIPTPRFLTADRCAAFGWPYSFPVMVKPADRDASLGINQEAVCRDRPELTARLNQLGKDACVWIAEEFIDGREFSVGLLELPTLAALPILEVCYVDEPTDHWRILDYNGKWRPESIEYCRSSTCCPARLGERLAERLIEFAKQAYRTLGFRHYGRIDFRTSSGGEIFVLEGNPNPDVGPTSFLSSMLSAGGWTHDDFFDSLVRIAVQDNSLKVLR